MERVRYDLLLVINTLTLAVVCNSAVWAVLLCVSAHQHRVPFLGIQPSNGPSSGSLEQIQIIESNLNLKSVARPLWISHPANCDGWNRRLHSIPQRCVQICNAPAFLQVWTAMAKTAIKKGEMAARNTVGAPRGATTTPQVSCKRPWGDGFEGIEF